MSHSLIMRHDKWMNKGIWNRENAHKAGEPVWGRSWEETMGVKKTQALILLMNSTPSGFCLGGLGNNTHKTQSSCSFFRSLCVCNSLPLVQSLKGCRRVALAAALALSPAVYHKAISRKDKKDDVVKEWPVSSIHVSFKGLWRPMQSRCGISSSKGRVWQFAVSSWDGTICIQYVYVIQYVSFVIHHCDINIDLFVNVGKGQFKLHYKCKILLHKIHFSINISLYLTILWCYQGRRLLEAI